MGTIRYRKAVFVVAYAKEGNRIYYLLLKRKLHWTGWEFPKGGLKGFFEKFFVKHSVKRELQEETGLKAIKIKRFDYQGKYDYEKTLKDRPGVVGQEFILYSAEVKKQKVDLSKNKDKEHSEYKWRLYKDALRLLSWPNQKKCLKIVNNSLKNEIQRKNS